MNIIGIAEKANGTKNSIFLLWKLPFRTTYILKSAKHAYNLYYVNAQNFQWCMTSVKTEQWICGFIFALSLSRCRKHRKREKEIHISLGNTSLLCWSQSINAFAALRLECAVQTFFIGLLDFRSAREFLYLHGKWKKKRKTK